MRAKTVARGATPAEAQAAAAKVSELTQSEQRAEAEAILVKFNWSPLQARGIVSALPHLPPWRNETSWRWPLLHDWASANQKLSPHVVETQLRFLTEDLRNAFCKIGAEISAATTEDETVKALKPYADKL